MTAPIIGISTHYEDNKQSLNLAYVRAIEQAGGIPIIIPMIEHQATARRIAALLDGLLMTGGDGITRGIIGTLPDDLPPVEDVRDRADALIYQAMRDKPLFGICYGMQFINAMAGGTIYGDLNASNQQADYHSTKRGAQSHAIHITEDSHLARQLSQTQLNVNTYHIQSLATIGDGLRVNALAPDGIIEGIESEDGRIMGLQFHPERMPDTMQPVFQAFVRRCTPSP